MLLSLLQWVLDALLCNGVGIWLGMKLVAHLGLKSYHWAGLWQHTSTHRFAVGCRRCVVVECVCGCMVVECGGVVVECGGVVVECGGVVVECGGVVVEVSM